MRERQGYRDTIEDLNRVYPVQGVLSPADVVAWMGCSIRTVQRHIRFSPMHRVSKADLARQVCLRE